MANYNKLNTDDNEVKVIITGDASPLREELNKAQKDISNFSTSGKTIDIKPSVSGLNSTSKNIKNSVAKGVSEGLALSLGDVSEIKKQTSTLSASVNGAISGAVASSLKGADRVEFGKNLIKQSKELNFKITDKLKKDIQALYAEKDKIISELKDLTDLEDFFKDLEVAYDSIIEKEADLSDRLDEVNKQLAIRKELLKDTKTITDITSNAGNREIQKGLTEIDEGKTSKKKGSIISKFRKYGANTTLKDTGIANSKSLISGIVDALGLAETSLAAIAGYVALIVVAIKLIKAIIDSIVKTAKFLAKILKTGILLFAKLSSYVALTFGKIGIASLQAFANGLKAVVKLSKEMLSIFSVSYKSGIDRIYEWSKLNKSSLAPSLDLIASCCLTIENALAAMAAPLLEYIAPLIDKLTNKVLVLSNAMSKLFALMSGKSSYTKVVKATTEYSKATDKATNSLKKFLLGIDELNLVPESDLGDVTNLFKEVSEDIENITPFQMGANFGKQFLDWMTDIDWTSIQGKARLLGAKLANVLNGIFSIKGLGAEFGNMLALAVNTGFEFLGRFFATFNGQQFGQQISDIVTSFFTNLNYTNIHQAVQDAVDDIVSAVNTFLRDLKRVTAVSDGISTLISNAVKDACDLINGIDWGQLVENIGLTLKKTIEKLPANDIADAIMTVFDTAFEIIENMPWPELALFGMDVINRLLEELPKTLKEHSGGQIGTKIAETLNVIIDAMDPDKISGAVNSFVQWVGEFWEAIKEKVKWKELVEKITEAIEKVDWAEAFTTTFEIIAKCWTYDKIFKGKIVAQIIKDLIDDWNKQLDKKISDITGWGEDIAHALVKGIKAVLTLTNPFTPLWDKINAVKAAIEAIKGTKISTNTSNRTSGGGSRHFASGGVVYQPTAAIVGEYPGARTNPEIITPENKMREVFSEGNNNLANVYLLVGRQIIAAIESKNLNVSIGDDQIGYAAARANNSYYRRTGMALI